MQLDRRALRRDIGSSSSSYGKTAAQLGQQVDARAAETTRRTRDGSTAAQHDQNVNVLQPAGIAARVEQMAADAAASGDPICVRAGCRRKARLNRNGVPCIHGKCKICN